MLRIREIASTDLLNLSISLIEDRDVARLMDAVEPAINKRIRGGSEDIESSGCTG